MSGGSLDYIQYKIDEAADAIDRRSRNHPGGVTLRAFASFLRDVGVACHKIEWDLSADSMLGPDEYAALERLMGPRAVLATAIAEAREARANLDDAITRAGAQNPQGSP